MTGLLFVIFVIAPLQHCLRAQQFPQLIENVADAHKNILYLAEELAKNCYAHLDRSYFETCNRPFGQPPDLNDSAWDFDFQLPICVALYDASLRICNSTNQNIKFQAINSTVLQSSLQQDERYGSKMICEYMRADLVESSFEKTKDWMIVFKKKIREGDACERKCVSVKEKKVNPLCVVILWVHMVTSDFQNQSTMEDDNPTGISDGFYDTQIQGSGQADSAYNKNRIDSVIHMPSASVLPVNVVPSGIIATNTNSAPSFQYNNEDIVEYRSNSPDTNSVENVPNNPVSLRKDGSSIIKKKPDGNTAVNVKSDGKSSDNKKLDTHLTKSDGIIVSQPSQPTNKEISNIDMSKETSNIDVTSVSPFSGQLEKNEASIMKNETKSSTTPLSNEKLKAVTHLPDKGIVSSVNNTVVNVNSSNTKLFVPENVSSSIKNTSPNKQILNSGKNALGKITDAPIENDDIETQTIVPSTKTETPGKNVAEQEENQNEDKYGGNSPGFGEDEDVGGDGGEGDDGDIGTGGGGEDDDDINIVADNEINQQTTANENIIVTNRFVNAENPHFFAYFMTMVVICIIGYLVFHNKQKIMALALEGRSRRGSRRRPNTAGYRKLDSNLEEAVTSACSTSVTHVIY